MTATNAQVRKFMDELSKHQMLGVAAARAGMDRKTASKYRDAGTLPSEMGVIRDWRTREDPFDADWEEIQRRLIDAPELEAKTVFEGLVAKAPEKYPACVAGPAVGPVRRAARTPTGLRPI